MKILALLISIFFVKSISAQPTFSLPDVTVYIDEIIEIEIKVKDFQEIAAVQFSVNWDAGLLDYDTITYSALLGLTVTKTIGGVGFTWINLSGNGTTLTDDITFIRIKLKAKDIGNTGCQLTIGENPTVIEILNTSGVNIGLNAEDGSIWVDGPTAILDFENNNDIYVSETYPNPVHLNGGSVINIIEVHRKEKAHIVVSDMSGKIIHKSNRDLLKGIQKIESPTYIFPTKASYLYSIIVGNKTYSTMIQVFD